MVFDPASFVFEGDSIPELNAGNSFNSYAKQFGDLHFAAAKVQPVIIAAVSGSLISTMAARYASAVKPHRPTANGGDGGPKSYLFIHNGINGISAGEDVIGGLISYINTAKTDGFTVVGITVLPTYHLANDPYSVGTSAVNIAYRRGVIPADFVWDAAAALPNALDQSLYPTNNLHPLVLGHTLMARELDEKAIAGFPFRREEEFYTSRRPSNIAAFLAHKNGTTQALTGAWTPLSFGFENYDKGGFYSAATGVWVPPAGPIAFTAQVLVYGFRTQTDCALVLYRNGVKIRTAERQTMDNFVSLSLVAPDLANGVDGYSLQLYCGDYSGKTVSGDANYTFFSGIAT